MKKILFLLILLFTMAGSAFAQPYIDLGSDSGNPGEVVTIPVTLTNAAGTDIVAIGVDIGYDTASLENPLCAVGPAGAAAGKDCSSSTPAPGVFRIGIAGLNTNLIGNGVVANVSFAIKTSATPCAKPLTNTPSASNPVGDPVVVTGSNGSVIVLPCGGTEICFDGIDNDGDQSIDCADSDCNGQTNGACQTTLPGICAAGTYTCENGAKVCKQNKQPTTEICNDGLDNDCDGLSDSADPGCSSTAETACFDGIDNDVDGQKDCADPDCANTTNGECQTGKPGICATGTYTCEGGVKVCKQNNQPTTEICNDGLDNDCDGKVDCDMPFLPDLTGQWIFVTQKCKETKKGIKCNITGKLTINNVGSVNARSSFVKFYLSGSGVLEQTDIYLKKIATGGVKLSKSKVKTFSYALPLGTSSSNKFIIALIDADNAVVESDETNNSIVYGPLP